jgi:aryl-alcohol dehydrogenase-like predicted oxidoreductase
LEYTTLGRTGLKVSVAGLGCGGSSALGTRRGKSEAQSIAVVQRAMDLGINMFDTANSYGTEKVLGKAIKGRDRDRLVISTKARYRHGKGLMPAQGVIDQLDESLRTMGLDYVDVFHLHGLRPSLYDQAVAELVPALMRQRDKGKIRFIGATESATSDRMNEMAARAATDDPWDVLMIAYHMLNQRHREVTLPLAIRHAKGIQVMYVVRAIFSDPERLRRAMRDEVAAGNLPAHLADDPEPLKFLVHEGGAKSVVDAAYRFVRHEPGCHVTLFGTGDIAHVDVNVASILSGPLPEADRQRLADIFGHLTGVGLDRPTTVTETAD